MRKNFATLFHKGKRYQIFQDDNSNWCFNLDELSNVCTGSKELQTAINTIHESIDERTRKVAPKPKQGGKKNATVRAGR